MSSPKKHAAVGVMVKRELGAWFNSFIVWLVTSLFILITGFMFFSTFFLANQADLRYFFELLPVLFAFFIPAITMRLFSDESRSGSLETLLTLPVSAEDAVAGKYIAALISCAALLVPSLFYVLACCVFGSPDAGPIVGGYIGALLLAAAFCSIGLFASAISKNQIVSFFTAFAICIVLAMIDQFAIILPARLADLLTFFSAGSHFSSISKGIIDSRDVIFFLSITAVFFGLTVKAVKTRRNA